MIEFKDIDAFTAHLRGLIPAVEAAGHRGVEAAAEIIRDEAKAELGTYQDQIGPFLAWAELADNTKNDRVRQGYTENDPGLRSGEMRDSITCTARGQEAAIGSNDDKLVWFDQGTDQGASEHQPPREVLGGAAFRKGETAVNQIGARIVWALRGLPPGNS